MLVLFLLVVGLFASAARAQQPDANELVKFDAFASTDAPSPGKPFTIAIHAKIQKPWHIYWLNPGDSGMATAFKIKVPEGWRAGDVRFPIPTKFDQPGGFVGYGYSDDAIFLVDVLPSADVKPDAKVEIECVYLVCDKICLPGRQSLDMEVANGRWHGRPDAWFSILRAGLPQTFPGTAAADGSVLRTEGKLTPEWSPFAADLVDGNPPSIPPDRKPPAVEVFPVLDDAMEIRSVRASIDVRAQVGLKFEARLLPNVGKPPDAIRLLVVYTDSLGARSARWISVPTSVAVSPK